VFAVLATFALAALHGRMTLSFRIGKIPVEIAPSFFVMTLVLGASGGDVQLLLAWSVIVLASVLVHELGHAAMGLAFGLQPRIALHGMGGTTSWLSPRELSPARRIAISLAGPGAGFVAAAVVWAIGPRAFPPTPVGLTIHRWLLFVNFQWGVLNLLPILPLDGGNVMVQLLNAATHGRGERPARIVSLVMAALAVGAALLMQSWWLALLAASFASINVRGLKDMAAREHDAPMREALKQAYDALDARDGARVLELARPVALGSRSEPVRAEALQLVAFGFLLDGRVADADAAIAALPKGYPPHPSLVQARQSKG
jgi:Zn-dependent protease